MTILVLLAVSFSQFTVGRSGASVSRAPVLEPGAVPVLSSGPQAWAKLDSGFTWHLQQTLPNVVLIDLSFADDGVGYACAELGIVYKTTNSGTTWIRVMDLGFPYYWYGVSALSRSKAIVTGFNNTAGWNGGVWRTENGGANPQDWSYVQVDPSRGWFDGNFCFRENLHSYITGISFCHSSDAGQSWTAQHSADPTFDGGVWFPDTLFGWTGGGQIARRRS